MPDLDYPIHILWQIAQLCIASLIIIWLLYFCVVGIVFIYEEVSGDRTRRRRW